MTKSIIRLVNESKDLPVPLRLISYGNILNLIPVFVFGIVGFILTLGDVGITGYTILSALFPAAACAVTCVMIRLNLKAFSGSASALYDMIASYFIQTASFGVKITDLSHSACALTFYYTINLSGYRFVRIDLVPIVVIGYLCARKNSVCGTTDTAYNERGNVKDGMYP